MIETNGLTKYYGSIAAVEDVSFTVAQGEIVGFLGPNGAGKTTTMRMLTGAIPPSRGTAKIAGLYVEDHPVAVKQQVGYLPENVPLYPEMLVGSYLSYVAEVKGVGRAERKRSVGEVMDRCGLEGMAKRVVGNLSKGYRQRVGLAQALIGNPPVLILDEPTEGLDPRQIIEIRQMIRQLAHDHTVLLSTHILPEAAAVCERVLIINRGRLVAEDKPAALAGEAGRRTILIEARGSEKSVRATLAGTPGVGKVDRDREGEYIVEVTDATDEVRGSLARALVKAGHDVLEIRPRTRTLEEVFIEAVSSDEGAKV